MVTNKATLLINTFCTLTMDQYHVWAWAKQFRWTVLAAGVNPQCAEAVVWPFSTLVTVNWTVPGHALTSFYGSYRKHWWLILFRICLVEIHITNEERKDKGGFLELKSVLTRVYGNKPSQSNNLTIWCMALSPVPGNKVWNISSEKITFSLGELTI